MAKDELTGDQAALLNEFEQQQILDSMDNDERLLNAHTPTASQAFSDNMLVKTAKHQNEQGVFQDSIQRGTDNMQANLYSAVDAVGEFVGSDAISDFGEEGARRNHEEAAQNPARVKSYKDIDSVSDAVDYAVEAVGENLPNMATVAGTGGVGAIVKGGATALAKRKAFATGAAASSYPMAVGEVQNELKEGGIKAPGTALLAGIPITGLDVFGLDKVVGSVFKDVTVDTAKGLVEHVARGFTIGGVAEMPTEAAQELITITARAMHDPTYEIFSDENVERLINAGLKGGIAGGTFGGGTNAVTGALAFRESQTGQNLDDDTVPESPDTLQAGVDAVGRGGRQAAYSATNFEGVDLPEGYETFDAQGGGQFAAPSTLRSEIERLDAEGQRHTALGYPHAKPDPTEYDGTVVQAVDRFGRTVQDVAVNEGTPEFEQAVAQAKEAAGEGGSVNILDAREALAQRKFRERGAFNEKQSRSPQYATPEERADMREDMAQHYTQTPLDRGDVNHATADVAINENQFMPEYSEDDSGRPVDLGQTREFVDNEQAAEHQQNYEEADAAAEANPTIHAGRIEAERIVSQLGKLFGLDGIKVYATGNLSDKNMAHGSAVREAGLIQLHVSTLNRLGEAVTGAAKDGLNEADAYSTLYHEVGHLLEFAVLRDAPAEAIDSILQSYLQWLQAQEGRSPLDAFNSRSNAVAQENFVAQIQALKTPEEKRAFFSSLVVDPDYATSISEWWAEQVVKYVQTKQADGDPSFVALLQRAADALMRVLRFLNAHRRRASQPEQSVEEFLDRHINIVRARANLKARMQERTSLDPEPAIEEDATALQGNPVTQTPAFEELLEKISTGKTAKNGLNYVTFSTPAGKKARVDLRAVIQVGRGLNRADDILTTPREDLLAGLAYLEEQGFLPESARMRNNDNRWETRPLQGQLQNGKLGLPLSYAINDKGMTFGSLIMSSSANNIHAQRAFRIEQVIQEIEDLLSLPDLSVVGYDGYRDRVQGIYDELAALSIERVADNRPIVTQEFTAKYQPFLDARVKGEETKQTWGDLLKALRDEAKAANSKLKSKGYSTTSQYFDPKEDVTEFTGKEAVPDNIRDEAIKPFTVKDAKKFHTKVAEDATDLYNTVIDGERTFKQRFAGQVHEERIKNMRGKDKAYQAFKTVRERLWMSSDHYLRAHGFTGLADAFHHRPGTTKTRTTWFEESRRMLGPFHEKIAEIVNELPHKREYKLWKEIDVDDPAYIELVDDLLAQKDEAYFEAKGDQTGVKVRRLFDDLFNFLNANGVHVDYRKGYFPLIADVVQWRENKNEITSILVEKGLYSEKEAHAIYDAVVENEGIALDAFENDDTLMAPRFGPMRERKIKPDVYALLRPYLINDLNGALTYYAMAATKRAAAQKMFSVHPASIKREWREYYPDTPEGEQEYYNDLNSPTGRIKFHLLDALHSGRIDQETHDRVRGVILESYFGRLGADVDPGWKRFSSLMVIYQNVRVLGFATLSSLVDAGQVLWRAHDLKAAIGAINNEVISKSSREDLKNMARLMGVIQDDVTDHVLNDQITSHFMGLSARKWNERFFRAILLTQWTNSVRVAGLAVGKDFLQRHANSNTAESARYLRELGVSAEQINLWFEAGQPINDQFESVVAALHTFVDEAVVRPDATIRPAWGSDPTYMLFFHLKSYLWGFYEQMGRGIAAEVRNAEGAKKALPIASFLALTLPFAAAGYEIRRQLSWWMNPPKHQGKEGLDYYFELAQRAGYMGPFQLMLDGYDAETYGQFGLTAIAGPTVDQFSDFFTQDLDTFLMHATPGLSQFGAARAWLRE